MRVIYFSRLFSYRYNGILPRYEFKNKQNKLKLNKKTITKLKEETKPPLRESKN